MLETIDLSAKLKKSEYKKNIEDLMIRVGELQRQLKNDKVPVVIVFEGWGAAGRGGQLNKFISALDPRGFTVHSTHDCGEGTQYPYMARFF